MKKAVAVRRHMTSKERYPLHDARISCTTNRSALSYKRGEEMVFTFRFVSSDTPAEGLFLAWNRSGDDGKTSSGTVPASETLTVRTSIDRPGFVCVNVLLKNARGTLMHFDHANRKAVVACYAGAGVEPEYHTDCGEPADFDEFWTKQKRRLAEVPFEGRCELVRLGVFKGVTMYQVSIPAPGPRPATGFLGIPAGAKKGSLPAIARFMGYAARPQHRPYFPADSINLCINAHGQELGRDEAYYKAFFDSINTNGAPYAFDPELNKNPETAFFNGMVMRVLRALEFLKTLPEWNGHDLIVNGGSQGALQATWGAALDPDVTEARLWINWCCNMAASTKKGLKGGWTPAYTPALDYYDEVFMAKRIKKAKVEIARAGLGDYVCPPSGLAVYYKNLATPDKKMTWVQGSNHGYAPEGTERIVWDNTKR